VQSSVCNHTITENVSLGNDDSWQWTMVGNDEYKRRMDEAFCKHSAEKTRQITATYNNKIPRLAAYRFRHELLDSRAQVDDGSVLGCHVVFPPFVVNPEIQDRLSLPDCVSIQPFFYIYTISLCLCSRKIHLLSTSGGIVERSYHFENYLHAEEVPVFRSCQEKDL
jgi:hypothetical protein